MSRAVSSAPWGLARWYLVVAPIPLGGGGIRTTANYCTRKCSEHEIPRQPVTSSAPAACVRRGAEARPATPVPPAPRSITPRGRLVRWAVLQAAPGTPGPARRKPNYCDPNLAHRRSVVEYIRHTLVPKDLIPSRYMISGDCMMVL
jgi:hypothetical protein